MAILGFVRSFPLFKADKSLCKGNRLLNQCVCQGVTEPEFGVRLFVILYDCFPSMASVNPISWPIHRQLGVWTACENFEGVGLSIGQPGWPTLHHLAEKTIGRSPLAG